MGVKAFACVPILYEGQAEGILAVDNFRSQRIMNQSDLNLLQGIAPQIGISINGSGITRKSGKAKSDSGASAKTPPTSSTRWTRKEPTRMSTPPGSPCWGTSPETSSGNPSPTS
jgi:hypothetical protein